MNANARESSRPISARSCPLEVVLHLFRLFRAHASCLPETDPIQLRGVTSSAHWR
jgi:hypothetical protein